MRRILDSLYDGAAALAAVLMVGTLVMVLASMIDRYIPLPALRGMDMYAGYCMAGAGFLALAHTLMRGEHIRVMLVLQLFKGKGRQRLELFCLLMAIVLSGTLAWFSTSLVLQSFEFHDVSPGQDATPLWIPQVGMSLGTIVFFVAFIDLAWQTATGRLSKRGDSGEPLHNE